MKVILTASSKLGKIGDIVVVKNGYAKNFLIPNKKAICLNKENQKAFDAQKHLYEQQNANSIDFANSIKTVLDQKNIIIIENASDDGHLYGSVNSALIAKKINEIISSNKVERNNIVLQKPIKEIGLYQINLNLHPSVEILAKVVVSRSESEISSILATAS
jgi:large subunit ribosomal protein L9